MLIIEKHGRPWGFALKKLTSKNTLINLFLPKLLWIKLTLFYSACCNYTYSQSFLVPAFVKINTATRRWLHFMTFVFTA